MGQQLEAQLNKIKQQAMNVDPFSLAKSGGEGLATLFGGEPSVPLNETIVNNFYAADENPTAIREQELNDYRRRTLIEDASSSYAEAVEILRQGDKNLEYVKSLQSNAKILETTPGAVTLDLSVKVENMKNLMKFIRLSVADLKIATAKDMLTISKHLNNYDKDVTQFNLDDYEYKREQVEDLESVPENEIDYTAENGADEDETADTLNDTSVKVEGYAPIMNTFLGKVANLFRSVKLIIYVLAGFGLVGIAFQAIKGRLRWGWLAGLTVGLFVLAAAGALVEYATGSEVSEYFGDTATGAGR